MVERVSLSLPQDLEDIAFRILRVCLALLDWMDVCLVKVSFESKVTPRILGWSVCVE